MNVKKSLENRIRGWFPKEPQHSENKVTANMANLDAQTQVFLRAGGLLLPIVGVTLIAFGVFFYEFLLRYDLTVAHGFFWPLNLCYISGIAVAIVGVTFRVRSTRLRILPIRKSYLAIGLALLTVTVLGLIFGDVALSNNLTSAYAGPSLLVRLLSRAWWFSPLLYSIGFCACLILFFGHKAFLKTAWSSSLNRWAFYALVTGAIIMFADGLLAMILLPPLGLSFSTSALIASHLTYFYVFVVPFGILCLIFGWGTLTSTFLNKRPFLFPTLYAAFLIATAVLLSISI